MHGLRVEQRHVAPGQSLSKDVARHFANRRGGAIVVTDNPPGMMAAVKKQWLKLEHQYQTECTRTLNREYTDKMHDQLSHMQSVRFSAKPPEDMLSADITFATADDFVATSSICQTAYITYEFSRIKLHLLTSWMPSDGLIVIYG